MTERSMRTGAVAFILIAMLVLSGCSGQPVAPANPASGGPAAPAGGGKITIGSPQEPRTLLPHFDLLSVGQDVQRMVFDCLLALDEKGNYVPQLAEVPTVENGGISRDGKTYTLKLRPGVAWADGKSLTSQDVKFTWQVVNNKDLPIPNRQGWNAVTDVETPADNIVVFKFAQPNVVFLPTLASENCHILPRHLLEGQNLTQTEFNRKPVGSGPFEVAEWVAGQHIRLVRNENYWQKGKPALGEIVFRVIPSTEGLRAAAERGEIDVRIQMSVADRDFHARLSGWSIVESPTYAWWHFWLNTKDPILADRRVRQALAYGIDKKGIADGVFRGLVEPLWAALPPRHWAHNPQVRTYPYDPARARALLEEAGWKPGADGVRVKDGKPLAVEILNISGEQERLQVIQIVQKNWQDLGIKTEIKPIDAPAFPTTVGGGRYQVAYGSFGERHEPVFNLWTSSNWTKFEHAEAAPLIRTAMTSTDNAERLRAIRRFQEIVAEEQPTIPLAPRPGYNAVSNRLQGFAPSLSGSFWNAADWRR